ncbi:inorganic diphosphatase [Ranunculus cassubicifolius]
MATGLIAAATTVTGAGVIHHHGHHHYSTQIASSLFLKNPTKCFHLNQSYKQQPLIKSNKRFLFTCNSLYKSTQVLTKELGQPESLDYRVLFHDDSGKKVSPWHDIPLKSGDGVFNFIVEIPKTMTCSLNITSTPNG